MKKIFEFKDGDKIFVAGAYGMVGSALVRCLKASGYHNILTPSRQDLDLMEQEHVRAYMKEQRPRAVFIAAAKVGGIHANATYPVEFLYDNIMIACNLIKAAHDNDVERVLFLGSTCIYPKLAHQPIIEESLLTGPLEETNEAYAIAKIAGLKLCQYYQQQYARRYFSVMPTNLYGPGDNYHPENSHVLPALLRRFHDAKVNGKDEVVIWGSGSPRREFLHVDDLAEACLFLFEYYDGATHVNVGSDDELSIKELGELVAAVVGFKGKIRYDASRPDGTPRKKSDTKKINAMGWKAKILLKEGLAATYRNFLEIEYAKTLEIS